MLELVVVITVLGIIVAAGSTVVGDSLKAVRGLNAISGSSSDVRAALDRVARELRAVTIKRADDTSLVGEPTGYLFRYAEPNSVKFSKLGTNITIRLDASKNLRLIVGDAPGDAGEVLVAGVGSLSFRYWQSLGVPAAGLTPCLAQTGGAAGTGADCDTLRTTARLVEISLNNVDRGTGGPVSFRTYAALRSR